MPTVQEKASFIAALNKQAIESKAQEEKRDAKASALNEIMGGGLGQLDRDNMRALMKFSVTKKEKDILGRTITLDSQDPNQREGIETEESKDYNSMTTIDKVNAHLGMEKILELRDKLLKKMGPDGKPLFTEDDIAKEIFTPLMREGILPETLIIDKHSETAKLLENVFKNFKKQVEKKKQETLDDETELQYWAGGGDGKGKKAKAMGKLLLEKQMRNITDKIGSKMEAMGLSATKQERNRAFKIGMAGLKAVKTGKKAFAVVQGFPMALSDAQNSPTELTSGYAYKQTGDTSGLTSLVEAEELADAASALPPQEIVLLGSITDSIESALGPEATPEVMKEVATLIDDALNDITMPMRTEMAKDENVFIQTMTMTVITTLIKTLKGGGKLAAAAKKLHGLDEKLKKAVESGAKRTAYLSAALDVALKIDDAICGVLAEASSVATAALKGSFEEEIDVEKWVDQFFEEEKKRDPQKIVDSIAEGVSKVITEVIESSENKGAFKEVANQFAKALPSHLKLTEIALIFDEQPADAFTGFVAPTKAAARAAFLEKSFVSRIQSKEVSKELSEKGKKDNSDLEDEMLNSAEDVRNFENQLVLIDEGGIELGKQKSIEKLILQLQRDRQVLMLVETTGKVLRGIGRGATSIGVEAQSQVIEKAGYELVKEVGEKAFVQEVGGQVVAALNAARLIIQLSVNAVRAAERWAIWYKFRADVEKALSARSALLPAIENFFNNKKEQIAYHTIEDAMLVIQLAGSITSTVPEPITLAVGKALTSVGKAGEMANKFAKKVYDENTIRRAWKRTLEAIDNPKNRKAGLQAIHDNILLAAHAVAWAAMQGDAIAEQIMRSCGVDAQTLADSETDAKKIVKYLMLFLKDSDKKGEVDFESALTDHEKINISWKPPKLELNIGSWFCAKNRAEKNATPKLQLASTKEIDSAFKTVQAIPTIDTLTGNLQSYKASDLDQYKKDILKLIEALKKYSPVTQDNSKHSEMKAVAGEYQEMAEDLLYKHQELTKAEVTVSK